MSAVLDTAARDDAQTALCMSAATPHGTVRLLLGAEIESAPQAAIALHRSAAWLDLLDDWLAPAGPLRWTATAWPAGACLDTVVSDADGAAPHRLALPWPLLMRLPAPPTELGLRWPAQAAELLLGRQDLPPEGLARLCEGSALLLEASFAAPRLAQLRRVGARQGRLVRHGGGMPGGQLWTPGEAAGEAAVEPVHAPALEFHQRVGGELAVECLAGWREPPQPLQLQPRAGLWWQAGGGAPQLLAQGLLMPWGRGEALRIEQIVDAGLLRHLAQQQTGVERAWT